MRSTSLPPPCRGKIYFGGDCKEVYLSDFRKALPSFGGAGGGLPYISLSQTKTGHKRFFIPKILQHIIFITIFVSVNIGDTDKKVQTSLIRLLYIKVSFSLPAITF